MRDAPGQADAEPCRAALVVLDFDGTLTDADAHAPDFHEASSRELARRLGWDDATGRREWARALAAVQALPPEAAWVVDGRGVCPAAGDPYLVANSVNRLLLSERIPPLDEAAIVAGVTETHGAAYARVAPPFRRDARALLTALAERDCRVAVVTNSDPAVVTARLGALDFRGRERVLVRGGAAKFLVGPAAGADPRFDSLPPTVRWPELGRPIHLRRGKYFDVLRALWDKTGAGPESTLAAGDSFELDLALPAALGAHVHLVTRPSTPPHEIVLARKLARGEADGRLGAIVERLGG